MEASEFELIKQRAVRDHALTQETCTCTKCIALRDREVLVAFAEQLLSDVAYYRGCDVKQLQLGASHNWPERILYGGSVRVEATQTI